MRQLIGVLGFLTLAMATVVADDKDDAKAAAQKLEGDYEMVQLVVAGKADAKKDEVKGVTIKGDTITIKTPTRDEVAKFTLDPTKKPAQITIMPVGGGAEQVAGIYEASETDKGLELNIAFAKGPGKAERPKDFKDDGKSVVIMKLLRKKAK